MSVLSSKKILMASLCGFALLSAKPAISQIATYYDNNVIVDLSVLEDNGFRASPSFGVTQSPAQMPPVNNPRSAFFGAPSGIAAQSQLSPMAAPSSTLRIPSGGETKSRLVLQRPATAAPIPVMPNPVLSAPNPAPSSLPEDMAQAPAKPASAPVQLVERPKPTPAPVAVVTETPTPAPAPVVEAKPAPAPEPAPVPVETVKVEVPAPALTPSAPAVSQPVAPTPESAVPPAPVEQPAPPAPAAVMAQAPAPVPTDIAQPREVISVINTEITESNAAQTAAIAPSGGMSTRVSFDEGASQFPQAAEGNLQTLAQNLIANPDDRVQLLAYAGGENHSASKARRLSLSRALAVRSFLIEAGVRSTRIDVRALGNKTTEEPFNRVDVEITPR